MIQSLRIFLLILSALILLYACGSGSSKKDPRPDTPVRGTIDISADESFKPIVDELVKVYMSNNPGTTINVQYKPEADCAQDLWSDSVRMVISTITLNEKERMSLVDSLKLRVSQLTVARDAVAVIVNPASPDSLFDMQDIKMMLTGTWSKPLIPVFDGVKTTSTVRYVVDSVLRGQKLTSSAMATRTSDSVVDYVAGHPNAVGFIGVSWIGNREDREQLSFLRKVKIAHLESNDIPGKYILPVQANIYANRYPMIRNLTYILKEPYRGLGAGFADFMAGEIGQLIFKRAYLMPAQRSFRLRPARLKE